LPSVHFHVGSKPYSSVKVFFLFLLNLLSCIWYWIFLSGLSHKWPLNGLSSTWSSCYILVEKRSGYLRLIG
jgi:hypothetical protein